MKTIRSCAKRLASLTLTAVMLLTLCMPATMRAAEQENSENSAAESQTEEILQNEQSPLDESTLPESGEETEPDTTAEQPRVFYVDSAAGSDENDGLSAETAWQSLDRVNREVFRPGDTILFRAGSVWSGQLKPQGSGSEGNPITIASYGSENGSRPILNGNGLVRDTVYLLDVEYYEVRDLEITNLGASVEERRAVYVENTGMGVMDHIYLQNLYIHDVNARVDMRRNHEGGIICMVTGASREGVTEESKFNDLLIENNIFKNVDYGAVFVRNMNMNRGSINWGVDPWIGNTNVVVRGNNLDDIGGDGIVVCECIAPLVEYNVAKECHMRCNDPCAAIWCINCDDALFQFNEAYLTRKDTDGQAFDADGNCHNTCFQYNYSHDNEGGFMLICNWYTPGLDFNDNGVIRYNISQNDRSKLFHYSGINTGFQVYNNTFYVGPGNNTAFSRGSGGVAGSTVAFYNNIFYNEGTNFSYDSAPTNVTFTNNLYYGNHPANEPNDPQKIVADPMLLAPGSGGLGLDSVGGYKLLPGSPCIDAGISIENRGDRDYFGNPISAEQTADIGAHEYTNDTPYTEQVYPLGTVWDAGRDFSDVSGQNGWSAVYFDASKTPHVTTWRTNDTDPELTGWISAQWLSDGGIFGRVNDRYMQVQDGRSPARCFQSPVTGVLRITGQPKKHNIAGAGDVNDDGVNVSILKNDTVVWGPVHIARDDDTGIPHDILLDVNKGDKIYFLAEQVGVDWYDDIEWVPQVEYVSEPFQLPALPEGAYYVDDASAAVRYTDMESRSYPSESQAYNKTAHVSDAGQGKAEFTFEGSGIEWISQSGPQGGNVRIRLYRQDDKGEETLVDEQTVSCLHQEQNSYFTAYSKTDLEYGTYRIVLENQPGEDDRYGELVLDAFAVHTRTADGEIGTCVVSAQGTGGTVVLEWNGAVVASGTSVPKGADVTVSLTPDSGLYTKGLLVNGRAVAVKDNRWLLEDLQQDTLLEAVFASIPAPENQNVALRKPVSVTGQLSTDSRYSKDHATDGHLLQDSTGWEAVGLNTTPASLTVDLQRMVDVNRIKLYWNGNSAIAPSAYTVEVSKDGTEFEEVVRVSSKTTGTVAHDFEIPVQAQYVRVTIPVTTDGTLTWNSLLLHEIEVYEDVKANKDTLAELLTKADAEVEKEELYTAEYIEQLSQAIRQGYITYYDSAATTGEISSAQQQLQALLDNPQKRSYQVHVTGGTGAGEYTVGETVQVEADADLENQRFTGWKAKGVVLEDASQTVVTFVMPVNDVTLTACFENKPSLQPTESPSPSPSPIPSPVPTASPAPVPQPDSPETTDAPAAIPQTGDRGVAAVWVLMLSCGVLAAAMYTVRAKRRQEFIE